MKHKMEMQRTRRGCLSRLVNGCCTLLWLLVGTTSLSVLVAAMVVLGPVLLPVAQAGWETHQQTPGDPLGPRRVIYAGRAMMLELIEVIVPDDPVEQREWTDHVLVHLLLVPIDVQMAGLLTSGHWPLDEDPVVMRHAMQVGVCEKRARRGLKPVYLHPVYNDATDVVLGVLYEVLKQRWAAGEFTPCTTSEPAMTGG